MYSVSRRRSESSIALMIQRREPPRRFGSSPIGMKNFVASTTSSRRPVRALSTKLMPASRAAWMMRTESSWSVLPQAPNIIVPRQSFETWTPVRPSGRYSTEMLLFAVAGLGVVDDLGVGLGAELLGVRAAADALVERVDRCDLLGGQREVEDVEVLGDAVRLDRLRDRAEAVFDVPAQDDLGRGLAVLGREIGDDRIGQRATRLVGARHVDQDAAERRPRLGQDGQLGVGLAHG